MPARDDVKANSVVGQRFSKLVMRMYVNRMV